MLWWALEDKFRVVFLQILKQLREVDLRDQDAVYLLTERDFEAISLVVGKKTSRLTSLDSQASSIGHSYKTYTHAYFEEVIIVYAIEDRVAKEFRKRVRRREADTMAIVEMYCKEDFEKQFQAIDKSNITYHEYECLFKICLKHDAWKIGSFILMEHLDSA